MKLFTIIAATLMLMACNDKTPLDPDSAVSLSKPQLIASNYPLFFFASEIAGESIDVSFPDISGDPAMWAPSGEQASQLQNADLLILNGAGYESWLAFTSLPSGHSIDTTNQLSDRLLPIENEAVHQHGPAGKHSHQGTAFTTWLDPQLAIEQARIIKQELSRLEPDQADIFDSNFEKLKQRLTRLDQSLAGVFAELGDQAVVFSHPVYQYLQQRYEINGRSMHWEPNIEPGTADWIDFGNLLREHPAALMIWEAPPIDATRQKLLQMGVDIVVFSPAGNSPQDGDYFTVMDHNLDELRSFLNRRTKNIHATDADQT
jgi:zinc transport system substrate-binding protein